MTDPHRPTDLSYGHPGKATYDTEEKKWTFSIGSADEQRVRQICLFEERVPPSIQSPPQKDGKLSDHSKLQQRKLLKLHPEIFPGNEIISNLAKAVPVVQLELPLNSGSVLAIGKASESKRQIRILATLCGEAGHVLRLIKLRSERRAWGNRKGPSLSFSDLDSTNQGHWMSTGGTIRQISFADNEEHSSTWMAVRQDTVTTVFKPKFGELQPANLPKTSSRTYPSSRLSANPVATLVNQKAESQGHTDVSFNPWYTRQVILVDASGFWSISNIEGQQKNSSCLKIIPGQSGHAHDGLVPADPENKVPPLSSLDGWYRALWVFNLNTIAVCNKRHIAIFNVRGKPVRLRSFELEAKNFERIIGVERSLNELSHIFVLTTLQVLWIEVSDTGAQLLLSYRHFRDGNDETLKLKTVRDENGMYSSWNFVLIANSGSVSVMISSSKSSLVNVYNFSFCSTGEPISWQGSFVLSVNLANGQNNSLRDLIFLPTTLDTKSHADFYQSDNSIRFLQVWGLTFNLSMGWSLCVIHKVAPESSKLPAIWTAAPTVKIKYCYRHARTDKIVGNNFIVPDRQDEENTEEATLQLSSQNLLASLAIQKENDLRLRIDWRQVFKYIFITNDSKTRPGTPPNESTIMTELLATLTEHIQQAKENNSLPMVTLFELSNNAAVPEELDKATAILHEFLDSLHQDESVENGFQFAITDLTTCPSMYFPASEQQARTELPGFLNIYDHLVDNWMASLPTKASVPARLSKYKAIRQAAVELSLSSIGISLRPKATEPPPFEEDEDHEPILNMLGRLRKKPIRFYSPGITPDSSQEPQLSLPTPNRTPSLYSHATNTSASEMTEDPAVSRLRQYAVSIRSRLDPGNSKLLSQWELGADPAKYSWEAIRDVSMNESGDEDNRKKRREVNRRRRMTERFLNDERSRATTAESQPAYMPPVSQPDPTHKFFSSQPIEDIPMTQPDRGPFGGRPAKKPKKGKRRNAGF